MCLLLSRVHYSPYWKMFHIHVVPLWKIWTCPKTIVQCCTYVITDVVTPLSGYTILLATKTFVSTVLITGPSVYPICTICSEAAKEPIQKKKSSKK